MEESKYPTDQEFLELLYAAKKELLAEKVPITHAWVDNLILETEAFYAIGEEFSAKRLAFSLITTLCSFELQYFSKE
ncbi:Uncharacterised protein [Corynebacterium kutscheri]|uniref:Uncharacterized protein n=1 Tax=Corynebacterium kutscheri TaxID=35755 RepID=A0A0F6R3D0_9CORY|nr:hypothetical protein [Corynebacterium kutscheri]AKE42213.1 hypothetical protein UL82_10395 [Corynebacterium kutscheri]VEH05750.1 Uncharacterised protein [Corynebacterium kutscheri]VEH10556.1 Uncharacterised protein [Corynebacterium kutscheri]VEH81645.1 Uncharacterised protein [Corynebacterium kutscheri]